jgi:hypothetical protein
MQATPTRPWEKEKSVRRNNGLTLLLGALIAYVVVLFTGFAGPDGWAVVLFALAATFSDRICSLDLDFCQRVV